MNTVNFQHLNNAKNNNLNLDQTNVKQRDNLEKLRLENFQHLTTKTTTTAANTEPNISSNNNNNAEESIEVEYIKYTDNNSTASVQTSRTFSLQPTATTTTDASEVTLTITNEHTLDDKDSAGDVSCDLDDLSCTVDYFLTDNETYEDQEKSDPVISASADINLPCPSVRAIDDHHSQQLSRIVDIFTDQI